MSVEDGAILEYENALELMDKNAPELMDEKARNEHMRDDIVAAMRLAGLYQKASRKTTDIAEQLKKLIIDYHKSIETSPRGQSPGRCWPEAEELGRRKRDIRRLPQGPLRSQASGRSLRHVIPGAVETMYRHWPRPESVRSSPRVPEKHRHRQGGTRRSARCSDDSVEVRTARYTFFNSIGDPQNATAELEQAILLDPENLLLILTAAENAMRSGPVGTFEPHFWLDQVPRSSRDDPRVLTVQGMVEYTEQKYEAALATWRKGREANPRRYGTVPAARPGPARTGPG